MRYIHIEREDQATGLAEDLASATRIALDCEAAGFHRYSDRLCLVQITTANATYVVDPLAFDATELLRRVVEDSGVEVVMHGADFDLRLLARDLGLRLTSLYDTQVAASLLAEDGLGLAALLDSRLGIKVSKKYQRADWADRPLTEGMLEYAASDTHHLMGLADLLAADVEKVGRADWVAEECRALEESARDNGDRGEPEDPVTRVKGARDLAPLHVTMLREALGWRDGIARARDRAPFRVAGDQPLIEAVMTGATTVEDLDAIKGFGTALARSEGPALLRRLQAVIELPESELTPYPRHRRRGPGRPPPELEALTERLKTVRNATSVQIGLERGMLLSNSVLTAIAQAHPRTLDELLGVAGMRRWKVDVMGEALLAELRSA